MLARREAIEIVGMLDDRFFMYCEDVDWCYRMRQQGWERWYVPSALITHRVGGSSDQRMLGSIIHFHQSMCHFYRKHYCTGSLWFAHPLAGMGISMRAVGAISRIFLHRVWVRIQKRRGWQRG